MLVLYFKSLPDELGHLIDLITLNRKLVTCYLDVKDVAVVVLNMLWQMDAQ